jgi:hypothetical protein
MRALIFRPAINACHCDQGKCAQISSGTPVH